MKINTITQHVIESVIIFCVFGFISTQNYLLFHGLIEIFSVIILGNIFFIVWSGRSLFDGGQFLLIGISAFFIGIIDIIHTLTYKGMGVFPLYDITISSQLWIGARYMQAISFVLAVLWMNEKIRYKRTFFAYTVATTLLFLSVFYWHNFPVTFYEQTGLTMFKIISEYIIIGLFVVSIVILFDKKSLVESRVSAYLTASLVLLIVSELFFTLYPNIYAATNIIGHMFKIVAMYLFLKGVVETALVKPRETLFQEIGQTLHESELSYRTLFESSSDAIMTLEPPSWEFTHANKSTARIFRASNVEEIIEVDPWRLSPEKQSDGTLSVDKAKEMIEIAMKYGMHFFEWTHKRLDGDEFPATVLLTKVNVGERQFLQATVRDITELKNSERALHKKVEEMEKLNALMVDRELKMIELKKSLREATK